MVCYDMVGKSSDKPLWRPLAHKFSTLILRRRPSKRNALVDDEKAQETPANFKPLEVRSNVLEGLHVPNSWLVESPSANSHDKLTLPAINLSESQRSPRSRGFGLSKDSSSRPFSIGDISGLLKTESDRASALATLTAADSEPKEERSVLDRGRPVEPRHLIHQPVRGGKPNRKSLPLELMFTAPVYNEGQTSNTTNEDSATKIDVASPSSFHESSPWTAEHRRRSTIRIVSRSPTRADETKIDTTSMTTTTTTDEPEPRRSQSITRKPVAKAPSTTTSTTPAPAPAPAPVPAPIRTPSVNTNNDGPSYSTSVTRLKAKQPSKLSDRLSWIKNLEEKNNDRPNKDLAQLPKRAGTVSDKLAMFERKNMSGTANKQHLLAPTRTYSSSHSSTHSSSYNSARGRESIFSTDSNANVSSTRTSIDTTHRTSSVMSYYDDTFRQKLESLVGQEAAAAAEEEETEETKVEEKE
ncbi:hypothetical protein QX201_012216 [Fusarium graminearum]|uniref:Chromosome 4, complete genome n=2 Tax=Gibberella zeae (strain ATCC MYA-4620 / CBS 123657 / FGSC 9075 / NRRL 31084 / PH-1) TaxID=229533 RepID=A0A1C3YL84_GIBZE|nr:unnamed protein product [Fusarium graminearum]SCB65300.1 unnamed protein product [Fusarium graminearum]